MSSSVPSSESARAHQSLEQRLAAEVEAVTPLRPPRIPDHELARIIGRGGYGEVWLARSTLGTWRAVKVVYRARFHEDRPYEREFRGILKYEPVSRTHEGLVQVLHVGQQEETGCFYYVMEVADSWPSPGNSGGLSPATYAPRTLGSELAAQGRLPARQAIELGQRLAGALAHLHARGLVHRDIKPGNVIFVGGLPKLADIGLVTDAGDARSFVGTEGFIPPEGPGTPAADVYSLGKLVYELAMGRDRLEFPQLPPNLEQDPDRDLLLELNEVLARACAPAVTERHANAAEFQSDLNLLLAGRSVRQTRALGRRLRLFRRLAAAALLLALVSVVALGFMRSRQRAASERAHSESMLRARAEQAGAEARQRLYVALLEQSRARVRSGEMGLRFQALEAVRQAAALSNSAELRGVAFTALGLPDLQLRREVAIGPTATRVVMDPTFARYAVARGAGAVELRSTAENRLLATLAPATNRHAYVMLFSPDGRYLAIKRDRDGSGIRADLEVWDTREVRRVLLATNALTSIAISFHPDSRRLLAGRWNGQLTLWNLPESRIERRWQVPGQLISLRWAPAGDRFAATRVQDGQAVVEVRTQDGELTGAWDWPHRVESVNWHPGGHTLVVPDWGGGVTLLDLNTGERRELGRHRAQAVAALFHPGGRYLISGGWDNEAVCWDTWTGERAFGLPMTLASPQFSADGHSFALFTENRRLQLMEFALPSEHRELPEDFGAQFIPGAFSPDGRWLAVLGQRGLAVWDWRREVPATVITNGGFPSFTGRGAELFTALNDRLARWECEPGPVPEAGPRLRELGSERVPGLLAAGQITNRAAVAVASLHGLRLVPWDGPGTSGLEPLLRWPASVLSAPANGHWLALTVQGASALLIHALPDGERVALLTNRAGVLRAEFSPDSQHLIVVTREGAELWETATWSRVREVAGEGDLRRANLVFLPDGRSVFLAMNARAAALCDARTLEPILPLPPWMIPLAVTPDGRHFAVSINQHRTQIWDLESIRQQLHELGLDWPAAAPR